MTTAPAAAIKQEVQNLIQHQIEVFTRPSQLTSTDLGEFHHHDQRLALLCRELDRMSARVVLDRRSGMAG